MNFGPMADTFSFSFNTSSNEQYCGIFYSSDGEEYVVSVQKRNTNSNGYNSVSGYYDKNCTLNIKWKKLRNKFIFLTSYDETGKLISEEKITVKGKLFADLSFSRKTGYSSQDSIVVLNIISFASIPECTNSSDKDLKPPKKEPAVEKRLEELSTNWKSLLATGNLSDIVLTDGSTEIKAHKLVLSVRSSVFAKMFQHPVKENVENLITIKDISIEILRSLLEFMYTGTVLLKNVKMARDLYVAADKYDVKSLKNICSKMLMSMDFENVIDTLLLADLYNDKSLRKAALNFIADNYSQVKTLQNWSGFMRENHTLAIEVLSFVLDKRN